MMGGGRVGEGFENPTPGPTPPLDFELEWLEHDGAIFWDGVAKEEGEVGSRV